MLVTLYVCVCLVCVPSSVSTYFNTLWPFLMFFFHHQVPVAFCTELSSGCPFLCPLFFLLKHFQLLSPHLPVIHSAAAAYAARVVRLVCVSVGVLCQTPHMWNSKWKALGWLTVKAKCAFIYLYLTSQVNNSLESGTEGGGGDGYKDETSVCVPVLKHYFHLFDFYGYSASLC